ncbi:Aste57867_12815 [Aphanomyces stellatus]|uniref:Aste57867_12815 protein n=1 Tax=Aphanomyces stellatus TaxID=120398 RepID=A0A485KWY9_9STRA|nr:hypothetical protein As57867_012767 [Aphanomyces stellatus]VFT89662.1 Aste57867_12815 [Aphanomyces stellatus]
MDGIAIQWERFKSVLPADDAEANPALRYGHAATLLQPTKPATTPAPSYVVVYGGATTMTGSFRNTDTPHDDVWLLTIHDTLSTEESAQEKQAIEWKQLKSINRPAGGGFHKHHTMMADGNCVYVFGNRVKGKQEETFETPVFEIHRFIVDIAQATAKWEVIFCPNNIPARFGHATTRVSNQRIVCFGGRSVGKDDHFNDVIVFDLDRAKISRVFEISDFTAKRSFFAMAALNSRLFVNGGASAHQTKGLSVMGRTPLQTFDIDEMAESDGNYRWHEVKLRNNPHLEDPKNKYRLNHRAVWLDASTVLFFGGTNSSKTPIMDVWAANVITRRHIPMSMMGDKPTPRSNPVLVKLSDSKLVCIGGKLPLQNDGNKWHDDGIYIGTIKHNNPVVKAEATAHSPLSTPITPLGNLKRKRTHADSPEAPQKRLETTAGSQRSQASMREETKESTEESPNDTSRESQLADELRRCRAELATTQAELVQAKERARRLEGYKEKARQFEDELRVARLEANQNRILFDHLGEIRAKQANSQSTLDSSQDSPADLVAAGRVPHAAPGRFYLKPVRVTYKGKTRAFGVNVFTMTLDDVQALVESTFDLARGTYVIQRKGTDVVTAADFDLAWNEVVCPWGAEFCFDAVPDERQ